MEGADYTYLIAGQEARKRGSMPMEANILDSIDLRQLGKELQEARKNCGMTQEAAAVVLGVARTTITAIEKGERRIKAGELISLARAYGRQVNAFVRQRPQFESFQK